MEREVLLTGIGGQGVQLAASTLGTAAANADFEVLLFGTYGAAMRGGSTASTVVIGQEPLTTPPDVDTAWAAIAMHHDHYREAADRLRPGGLVVVDSSVFRGEIDGHGCTLLDLPFSTIATEAGYPQAASMLAVGAFCAATRVVPLDALTAAAYQVLPSYRAQFADTNAAALTQGWGLVGEPIAPAWPQEVGTSS
ncbi:MAG TPA: 2-oxoacid:acceptor oxidoreductase family protein [Acidimicrobiales bacterium]